MQKLEEIQRLFWQLTQAPEGVTKKFAMLRAAGDSPVEELNQLISEGKPGQALKRMEVYAQMYFWRIFESLEEDFALTAALLGKSQFHRSVVEYLKCFPSRTYDLALVGKNFPRFLQNFCNPLENPKGLLTELAGLEWQVIEVSREADSQALTETKLKEIPADQWEELKLQRIPASRVFLTHFDLMNPWRKKVTEGENPKVQDFVPMEQKLVLWRQNYDLQLQDIPSTEADLLLFLQEPRTFSQLCELCYEIDPESAPQLAAQFLKRWVDWGLLLSPSLKK
ncbi:MAG: DNA-binding domain-containing protein [bacterium]|nr:DNA-binding domain-containing protein [bacterium]